MITWKRLLCTSCVLIPAALLLVLPGCTSDGTATEIEPSPTPAPPVVTENDNVQVYTPPTQPGPQFSVELSLSNDPELGRPVRARAVFRMTELHFVDPPVDITGRILLPDSFVLVDGSLNAGKSMSPGDILQLEATIKAVEVCEQHKIEAIPYWSKDSGEYPEGIDTIYLYVFSDRAFQGHTAQDIEFMKPGQGYVEFVLPPPENQVMLLELDISRAPSMGETVELTLSATATKDAPDARIYFSLPTGIEFVSGDRKWEGDLTKGQAVDLTVKIRASETGVYNIAAIGHYRSSADSSMVAYVYQLRIFVFEDGAEVFHVLPTDYTEMTTSAPIPVGGGKVPTPVLPPPPE